MKLAEAWDRLAKLIRRLDPSNDIKHLSDELRAHGWIVTVDIRRQGETVLKLPAPEPTNADQVVCSQCGSLVPGGGCKPCRECGTMSGGCA